MRYKIVIEYDGSYYNGWQKQENELTIQGCLETAIYNIFHQNITIFGSGRTDAGVHAKNQVAHFDLNVDFPCSKMINAINFHLREQTMTRVKHINCILKNFCINNNEKFINYFEFYKQDIVVKSCEIVDNEFDARYSAIERKYEYLIYNSFIPNALMQNRAWQIQKTLDLDAMNEACQYLIGRMDFSSFRSSACQAKNPTKTVNYAKFKKLDEHQIVFNISAKSFLHHMVRNLVGTLKDVGFGNKSVNDFKNILARKDRKQAGITAPAFGLYLIDVKY